MQALIFLSPAFPPTGGKKKQCSRSKAENRFEKAWFIARLVIHLRIIKSWLEVTPDYTYQ